MKTTISLLLHEMNRLVCSTHTLLSLRSEWSQGFHIHVSYEVRPSPDVAFFFFKKKKKHWLCYLWDCSASPAQISNSAGHWNDGGIGGGQGILVTFLVQYAVHKSLAHKSYNFSQFLLLLNGYIAVFFH